MAYEIRRETSEGDFGGRLLETVRLPAAEPRRAPR